MNLLYRDIPVLKFQLGSIVYRQTILPDLEKDLEVILSVLQQGTADAVADAVDSSWKSSETILLAALTGMSIARKDTAEVSLQIIKSNAEG